MTAQAKEIISIPKQQPDRRWLSVGVLVVASLIDRIEEIAISILWPQMYRSLGVSVGRLGSVLAISQLVGTLLLPLWGYAVDRYSRKNLLILFTGFWGLWTCAIGLIDTMPQLLTVRALSALGLSVLAPAAFSLVGDLFDKETRGRSIGILRAAPYIAAPVAFIALLRLANQGAEAWRWGFIGIGLASFMTGLLMLFLKEPVRGRAEPELRNVITNKTASRYSFKWQDLRTLITIRSWWWLALRAILGGLSIQVFFRWFFSWLDELGLGESGFIVFIVMLATIVVGLILFGWLGDRLEQKFSNRGRLPLVLGGLVVELIALLLLLTVGGDSLVRLSLLGFVFTLGFAATADNVQWPIAQAIISPELRGSGQAFIAMAVGLSSAAALAASGWMADQIGVSSMLLLFTPLPILLSIGAWLPMFHTYPHDRDALHKKLTQRRADMLEVSE